MSLSIKKLSDSRGDAALCSDIVRDAYGHLQKARPVEIHDEEGRDVTDPAAGALPEVRARPGPVDTLWQPGLPDKVAQARGTSGPPTGSM